MKNETPSSWLQKIVNFAAIITGIVGAISILFSSTGFLVVHSHYQMLGLSDFWLHFNVTEYLYVGALFFLNSFRFLLGSFYVFLLFTFIPFVLWLFCKFIEANSAKKLDYRKDSSELTEDCFSDLAGWLNEIKTSEHPIFKILIKTPEAQEFYDKKSQEDKDSKLILPELNKILKEESLLSENTSGIKLKKKDSDFLKNRKFSKQEGEWINRLYLEKIYPNYIKKSAKSKKESKLEFLYHYRFRLGLLFLCIATLIFSLGYVIPGEEVDLLFSDINKNSMEHISNKTNMEKQIESYKEGYYLLLTFSVILLFVIIVTKNAIEYHSKKLGVSVYQEKQNPKQLYNKISTLFLALFFILMLIFFPLKYGKHLYNTEYPRIKLKFGSSGQQIQTELYGTSKNKKRKVWLIKQSAEDLLVYVSNTKFLYWIPKQQIDYFVILGKENIFFSIQETLSKEKMYLIDLPTKIQKFYTESHNEKTEFEVSELETEFLDYLAHTDENDLKDFLQNHNFAFLLLDKIKEELEKKNILLDGNKIRFLK